MDYFAQANAYTQKSEMVTLTPGLAFYSIFLFGLYNAYGISQLPPLTNHMDLFKSYSL